MATASLLEGWDRLSSIFQRPLCEMGRAFDYAYRPIVGDPTVGDGGPCDDRPIEVELCSAGDDPASGPASFRRFLLCPEHRIQLERYDARLRLEGRPSRFRATPTLEPSQR